jgi:hypothetical protein
MPAVRRLLTILALAWCAGAAPAGTRLARFEPADGCYLGAFIEHDALAHGDFGRFESIVGKHHACYINYAAYGRPFPAAWVAKVAAHGAAAHLAFEPNGGLDTVRDDAYLRGWARAAAAAGIPIFLRFASEMNGNWMAYSGDPERYIEKWRLVFRVMREEAPNVAMVWCPFSSPRDNIPRYYPGDDWVDWVGVNIYSVYYHNNDLAQYGADEDPRHELRAVYDRYAAAKPIMICEYAASHRCRCMGGDTVSFALAKMAALYDALPAEFPRVKCVQWFSWDTLGSNAADNDYSLTAEPNITASYQRLTASAYFRGSVVGQERFAPAPPPVKPPPLTPPPVAPPPLTPPPAPPLPPLQANLPEVDDQPELRPMRTPFGILGLRPEQRVTGRVQLSVYHPPEWQVDTVICLVNGELVTVTNVPPYHWTWNAAGLEPGRYELQVRLIKRDGTQVTSPALAVEVRRP